MDGRYVISIGLDTITGWLENLKIQRSRAMRKLIILILLLLTTTAAIADDDCYPYEPETVSIYGTLAQETLPGPPNYESIESGDKPETYYFLNLASPICTAASTK